MVSQATATNTTLNDDQDQLPPASRTVKACYLCRLNKKKCLTKPGESTCNTCKKSGSDCTPQRVVRKGGVNHDVSFQVSPQPSIPYQDGGVSQNGGWVGTSFQNPRRFFRQSAPTSRVSKKGKKRRDRSSVGTKTSPIDQCTSDHGTGSSYAVSSQWQLPSNGLSIPAQQNPSRCAASDDVAPTAASYGPLPNIQADQLQSSTDDNWDELSEQMMLDLLAPGPGDAAGSEENNFESTTNQPEWNDPRLGVHYWFFEDEVQDQ